jgi:hypothetical protein
MRRSAALLLAGALLSLPLGGTNASACAPPAEGEPHCCERTLVTVTVGDQSVSVPDPTFHPQWCD